MKKTSIFGKLAMGLFAGLCFLCGINTASAQGYTANFADASGLSNSYNEYTFTLANQNWHANNAYKSGDDFRLGSNKADNYNAVASQFSDLGLGNQASVVEMQWDMQNVSSISFTSAKTYGSPSSVHILSSTDGGETWSVVFTDNEVVTNGVKQYTYNT